jgi:hypothetical protein
VDRSRAAPHERRAGDAEACNVAETVEATTDELPTTATAKATPREHAAIEIEFCGARIYLRQGVDAKMLRRVLDVLAQR